MCPRRARHPNYPQRSEVEHCRPIGAVQSVPPYALPGDDMEQIRSRTIAVGADTVLLNAFAKGKARPASPIAAGLHDVTGSSFAFSACYGIRYQDFAGGNRKSRVAHTPHLLGEGRPRYT